MINVGKSGTKLKNWTSFQLVTIKYPRIIYTANFEILEAVMVVTIMVHQESGPSSLVTE